MACHIRITGGVTLDLAKKLGELVAGSSARHVRSPARGIYLVDDTEDDMCDIEAFLVANRIEFRRTTYRPSQMGQEPHCVTFRLGMTAPETTWL